MKTDEEFRALVDLNNNLTNHRDELIENLAESQKQIVILRDALEKIAHDRVGKCVYADTKELLKREAWAEEALAAIADLSYPSKERKMSIEKTLDGRESTYGKFSHHAEISQELKEVMYRYTNPDALSNCQKEALEMIMHKIARIINGNPNHVDNWHDIAGYATLVERELTNAN